MRRATESIRQRVRPWSIDDSRFRALTGIESPPADRAWLSRLIDFCIAEGFLLAEPVPAD